MTDFLQLASLRVVEVNKADSGYIVDAAGRSSVHGCPHCKSTQLYGHGTVQQTFRDVPSHGHPVTLQVQRQRYRCRTCSRTSFEQIADLDDQRLATRRFVEYVQAESIRRPFLQVAEMVGVDEKTVRNMFVDHVRHLEETIQFETPEELGMDEVKLLGTYRCMLVNLRQRTIFNLLPSRAKKDLMPYFQELPNKHKVKWVAMDMWTPYRQVVTAQLPHARIVADRFHIQRMATNAVEAVRKQVRKSLTQHQRLKMKDDRHVLLSPLHKLGAQAANTLNAMCREFPELAEAHALKEGFISMWNCTKRADAEKVFDAWSARIPTRFDKLFGKIARTVLEWRDPVFSYWDNPNITNGITENRNGFAKSVNRLGRGYSFPALRARLLFDPKARAAGAQIVQQPVAQDGAFFEKVFTQRVTSQPPTRVGYEKRVVEYGPSIEVLTKMLVDGEFDDKG